MRRPLAALAALLLLAACAQTPRFAEPAARAAAVGMTETELLAEFGEPDERGADESGERLVYLYDRVVRYGASGPATAVVYRCRVTFTLVEGRVAAVQDQGPDCNR